MGRPAFTPRPLSSAQSALVLSLLDWVESGVEKYARRSGYRADRDELRSAAHLALCRAALKFDPARGAAFKTYAMYWTEMAFRRAYHLELRANGYHWTSKRPTALVPVLKRQVSS